MNLSPVNYAEMCKQLAQISALVAGFSFAFISVLITSTSGKRITNWVIGFSIASIAGFLICALTWTLNASRMSIYIQEEVKSIPAVFVSLHRILSLIFTLSFFLFFITLGLTGWIRSKKLGIVSSAISLSASLFFIYLLTSFIS